jgi:hypothetical protein
MTNKRRCIIISLFTAVITEFILHLTTLYHLQNLYVNLNWQVCGTNRSRPILRSHPIFTGLRKNANNPTPGCRRPGENRTGTTKNEGGMLTIQSLHLIVITHQCFNLNVNPQRHKKS